MDGMKQWQKTPINVFDSASDILKGIHKGVGLTTRANGRTNIMAISWGFIGLEWNKPIFVTLVRQGRFTHKQLEENGEFTINIPLPEDKANKIIAFIGRNSGFEHDKITEGGLTLVEGEKVNVPAIAEMPITLECKVIYKQNQDLNSIPEDMIKRFYPQDVPSNDCGSNKDIHTMYYGEIVNAYRVK